MKLPRYGETLRLEFEGALYYLTSRGSVGEEMCKVKIRPQSHHPNPTEEGTRNLGPLPRRDYEILNRIPNGGHLDARKAYALEAKDGKRDDVENTTGRGAFRFHEGSSQGCITTHDLEAFKKAAAILDNTRKSTVIDANGVRRTHYGEFHVFSGQARPKGVLEEETRRPPARPR